MGEKKDLLSIEDLSVDEIQAIVARAGEYKRNRLGNEKKCFAGKSAVLIFEKPSLRTKISFETAIYELGGHAVTLTSEMVGLGKRESPEDVARNLERLVHLVVARTFSQAMVDRLARSSSIPVINALTDTFHPCQALAFCLTLEEHFGSGKKKIVFVGDGNNVCNSIAQLCALLGFDFTLACPAGYEPNAEIWTRAVAAGMATGAVLSIVHDPAAAVVGATAVYTDVWASMGQENEAEKRKKEFAGYQVNAALLSKAPAHAVVSHCLPAHRGDEITGEVLDSDRSIAFDEAENRLHIQKAVIDHLFS